MHFPKLGAKTINIYFLRRPKQTLKVEEDSGDAFDPMKYIKK